jgi:hypothetical protein
MPGKSHDIAHRPLIERIPSENGHLLACVGHLIRTQLNEKLAEDGWR